MEALPDDGWSWIPDGKYAYTAKGGFYSVSVAYAKKAPTYTAWAREPVTFGSVTCQWHALAYFRDSRGFEAAKAACVAHAQGRGE